MDIIDFLESGAKQSGIEVKASDINISDMVDKYCEIVSEIYSTILACLRRKIALFYSEIKNKSIPFDISDPILLKLLKAFLLDPGSDIHKYIDEYHSQNVFVTKGAKNGKENSTG